MANVILAESERDSSRPRRETLRVAKSQFAIIYRNVPPLLRQMRESAGLTQREFAKKVGKSQSWVFKTESAARRIDIAEFLEWSLGCGVDPKKAFEDLIRTRR